MENKQKKQGLIAGISLIIMALAAGFSFGYAHNSLVTGNPEITFNNLIANKSLFLAELSGWSLIILTDIIVAVALFYFFRSVTQPISMITAVLRILYTLILGIAVLQLFRIVPFISLSDPFPDKFNVSEAASLLQMFENLWSAGLIVFGLHLIGLGYLSIGSRLVPRLIGYLLYFGGFCYIFVHSSRQLSLIDTEALSSIENILALPMALAEILLAFWLIYHGFRKTSPRIKS